MRLTRFFGLVALSAAATVFSTALPDAGAQEKKGKIYYIGTHTKHTNVSFVSEADIETIYGSTNAAGGQTWIDFEGGKAKCRVNVPVKHLKTGIETRDEHLRGEKWMNAAKYPEISFRSGDITKSGKTGSKWKAKGRINIKGVMKDLTADVKIRRIPEKLWKKLGKGEWVKVTTTFDVKITDFGIEIPEGVGPKVSDTWTVKFQVYATTVKPEAERAKK
jgi:polyisoprenoid-binding protein YceI